MKRLAVQGRIELAEGRHHFQVGCTPTRDNPCAFANAGETVAVLGRSTPEGSPVTVYAVIGLFAAGIATSLSISNIAMPMLGAAITSRAEAAPATVGLDQDWTDSPPA